MSMKDKDQDSPRLSRRGFLKGVGAGAVATGLVKGTSETPEAAAQSAGKTIGPGSVPITLNINGEQKKLQVEPRVTLLDVLRNRLNITGAKKVCDRGTCGACTVLMDGEVVYACSILAIEAEGSAIATVESLGTTEQLSDVQKAFIEHDGLQCGFCTPGFVVATTDFVQKHPGATLEDVRNGMGGNFCRCGTYKGITEAALDAAKALKGGA